MVPEWQDLYGNGQKKPADITRLKSWHYPAGIKSMLGPLEPNDEAFFRYKIYSHSAHLTPLAARLNGARTLAGFSHEEAERAIRLALHEFVKLFIEMGEYFGSEELVGVLLRSEVEDISRGIGT